MSHFDDSSFEMHDDSLTPDAVERLLSGEITSPELADLAAVVADVRNTTSTTPTPAVRGALAEYVGVGLTATESPAPAPAPAAVSQSLDLTTATQPRRRKVIAEVVTFGGTLSGKLLLGGAVAAASVTGASASGLVDLPVLDDKPATVVVADEPAEDVPGELPLQYMVDDAEPEVIEPAQTDEDTAVEDAKEIEAEAIEDAVQDAADKAAEAADELVEEQKDEEEKDEDKVEPADDKKEEVEDKADDKEKEGEDKENGNEEAVAALEAQLLLDKEAVYAAATALIEPLEAQKKPLVQALEGTLTTLEQARNDAKAPLYAELETTEDEARKAEIEAELGAIYDQWVIDRDAALAAADPAIAAIEAQLTAIEIERDAEITLLLEAFRAAVDALD